MITDFSEVSGVVLTDDVAHALARVVAFRSRLLLIGPPGVGKTMIARRIPTLLGPLSDLESTWLSADFASLNLCDRVTERPFRAPHHTVSEAALVGSWQRRHVVTCWQARDIPTITAAYRRAGRVLPWAHLRGPACTCDDGGRPGERYSRPGEADLARFGVLYLDELTEFRKSTLVALRDRLDAMGTTAPLVVASANPCPCGWRGQDVAGKVCVCTDGAVARYVARLNEATHALRITANVALSSFTLADLRATPSAWSSARLRDEVAAERAAGAVGYMSDSPDWARLDALKAASEESAS